MKLDPKALEAATGAWLDSASDYTRLNVSIEAAITAYLAALPQSRDIRALVERLRKKRTRVHDLSGVGYEADEDCIAAADLLSRIDGEGWQTMDSAPLDGKHVLLCVRSGPFFYAVEGAFSKPDGWLAAFAGKVDPVYWAQKPKGFVLPEPSPSIEEPTQGSPAGGML